VVLSLCDLADNAWVRVDLRSAIREGISVSRHELSLVVAAAVADNDLGGIFVGHKNSWARQSTPVSVHAVWFKWFFHHTSVEHRSNFEIVGCH